MSIVQHRNFERDHSTSSSNYLVSSFTPDKSLSPAARPGGSEGGEVIMFDGTGIALYLRYRSCAGLWKSPF